MNETKYASLIEAMIYKAIRHEVEDASEKELREQMDEAGFRPEADKGFFHLYRAMNDGIAYCGCAPDPYLGIQHPDFAEAVLTGDPLVFVSHGWAAPGEWDGLPSECPDRRRVRLTVVVESLGKFVSILRFYDAPDEEPLYQHESKGPLRDAIESRMAQVLASRN